MKNKEKKGKNKKSKNKDERRTTIVSKIPFTARENLSIRDTFCEIREAIKQQRTYTNVRLTRTLKRYKMRHETKSINNK